MSSWPWVCFPGLPPPSGGTSFRLSEGAAKTCHGSRLHPRCTQTPAPAPAHPQHQPVPPHDAPSLSLFTWKMGLGASLSPESRSCPPRECPGVGDQLPAVQRPDFCPLPAAGRRQRERPAGTAQESFFVPSPGRCLHIFLTPGTQASLLFPEPGGGQTETRPLEA